MNLLLDPWISVKRANGVEQRIAPFQIVDPEIRALDIMAPRPDFRAALYQFLIGLLQTAYSPQDMDEWTEHWKTPPTVAELRNILTPWEPAFELDATAGPAFMQDFDSLEAAEPVEIARLLIDNPGDKTVQDSNDHFVHGGTIQALCPACAATALLTLQLNAPSGGAGHRVSVRGGGPLTTLRIPIDTEASLWHKLWSNVLSAEKLDYRKPASHEAILPWLAPTRTSEENGSSDTTPQQAHELQAYWSTPRRIRLDWVHASAGFCDICGNASNACVRHYRTRPYGVNYVGAWVHPLTPYVFEAKPQDPPLSIKGQRGGIGYRQWLGLAIGNSTKKPAAAEIVSFFNGQRGLPTNARHARLWCFGYDMDNMKARCWYDATLPLPTVSPQQLAPVSEEIRRILDSAGDLAFSVRRYVGAAVHGDGAADPAIGQSFWQESEGAFYAFVEGAMRIDLQDGMQTAELYANWLRDSGRIGLQIFDRWVLAVPVQDGKVERKVQARADLQKSLYRGKHKELWDWIKAQKETATV